MGEIWIWGAIKLLSHMALLSSGVHELTSCLCCIYKNNMCFSGKCMKREMKVITLSLSLSEKKNSSGYFSELPRNSVSAILERPVNGPYTNADCSVFLQYNTGLAKIGIVPSV